jgi:hypothetical protein
MPQNENPAPMGVIDARRSSMRLLEDKRPDHKFAFTVGVRSTDIKAEAANRPPSRRYLEFRLSITFAWFRYSRRFFSSATTVSMVTPDTPFSKLPESHPLTRRAAPTAGRLALRMRPAGGVL